MNMGGRKPNTGRSRKFKPKYSGKGKGEKRGRNHGHKQKLVFDNAQFNEYYKAQGIVPEGEWEAFKKQLTVQLPVTLRINEISALKDTTRNALETTFQYEGTVRVAGRTESEGDFDVPAPAPVAWYPRGMCWQIDCPRALLRKNPKLKPLHKWLVHANEAGSVTRQELVSMIPPLLLDVQPHHLVFDMCAAPGSKVSLFYVPLHFTRILLTV